ncbi:IMPACT family protein [Nigerium massiliense]|uniref:IMPACT family protein n=1 Tax=Nigerium massiliense TaxID=1522317 RepID=UPI0006939C08|nr:YigZ family protein [Nigerium massiliense]
MLMLPAGHRREAEIEVRRSRFIATVARADSEEAARAVVADVRGAFPDARHHCSAFIVEVPGAQPVERSSDDGEPAGTAGMPMLETLRGAGLTQVVAVVTRYFGGVLLGTGGLVRAYSDAVAAALDGAPRVRPVRRPLFRVVLDHADAGRVQGELLNHDVTIVDASYDARVTLTLAAGAGADLPTLVAAATQGAVVAEPAGELVDEEPAE